MSDIQDKGEQRQKRSTEPRRRVEKKILRPRPVAGEIDYTELSREHIARYPKIRARLAE